MVFGYARISTPQQSIDRQIRNIKAECQEAKIYQEAFTGTKLYERKELDRLLKRVEPGDTIIFDSVSRMSRNASDGAKLYFELYEKRINLIFLKEPHINTKTYNTALETNIAMTGDDVDIILEAVNKYLRRLAQKQIELAFEQSQKEVDDLHKRTAEGIKTARLNGKQIGQREGAKLNIKKAAPAKAIIRQHSRTFGGSLSEAETMKLTGLSRNTYFKYKRELLSELATE